MKKVAVFLWALVLPVAAQAIDLGSVGKVFGGQTSVNAAVGVLQNSSVDAQAEAQNGGKALAGGVLADQNTANRSTAVNAAVGVLKNSHINARAKANGQNSKAYAGGIISTTE